MDAWWFPVNLATISLPSPLPVAGLCEHRCGRRIREIVQQMDKMSRICCVSCHLPGLEELGENPGLVPPNENTSAIARSNQEATTQPQTSPVCSSPSSTYLARSSAGVDQLFL